MLLFLLRAVALSEAVAPSEEYANQILSASADLTKTDRSLLTAAGFASHSLSEQQGNVLPVKEHLVRQALAQLRHHSVGR